MSDHVRDFFAGAWTADELVRFHAAENAQRDHDPAELAQRYRRLHSRAMEAQATPGRQANALMHLAGHLKETLGSAERRELRDSIEDFRLGHSSVEPPLALLERHLREAR